MQWAEESIGVLRCKENKMLGQAVITGLVLLYITFECDGAKSAWSDESSLRESVFRNYESQVRPFNMTSVSFGVALIRINEFDEKNGIATLHLWERWIWQDERLRWDPDNFAGINQLYIPIHMVWQPDITLITSVSVEEPHDRSAQGIVTPDGNIQWFPRTVQKVVCSLSNLDDGKNWRCPLKYGSWVYDGFKLDIYFYDGLNEIDMYDYRVRTDIQVTAHAARKNVQYYPCCKEPYSSLLFDLHLRTD